MEKMRGSFYKSTWWLGLFLLGFSLHAQYVQTLFCSLCQKPISGNYYRATDQLRRENKLICRHCQAREWRCALCSLPILGEPTSLADGRHLCWRDAQEAVLNEEQAARLARETREEVARLLSQYLRLPDKGVSFSLVDQVTLELLFKNPANKGECVSTLGFTHSQPLGRGVWKHSVRVLNGLNLTRFKAVCAHEFAHAWRHENRGRLLDKEAEEAFCELVAYKLMAQMGAEGEMKTILENRYTGGQIRLFVEVEARYGFYTLLQWMQAGTETRLDPANLDRVRQVQTTPPPPPAAAATPAVAVERVPPPPLPDTLQLKGISGLGNRRLALVNNCPLQVGEEGEVKLARAPLRVRCLEIRERSVVLLVEGEKRELFLKGN